MMKVTTANARKSATGSTAKAANHSSVWAKVGWLRRYWPVLVLSSWDTCTWHKNVIFYTVLIKPRHQKGSFKSKTNSDAWFVFKMWHKIFISAELASNLRNIWAVAYSAQCRHATCRNHQDSNHIRITLIRIKKTDPILEAFLLLLKTQTPWKQRRQM